MANNYSKILRTPTPQSEPLDSRQVQNNAGGYTYAADQWDRLLRFLILGSDAGTYYVGARALTLENAGVVQACVNEDYVKAIDTIASISS